MRDGELDGQDQESKGQKPPCFLRQEQSKSSGSVFRVLRPFVALSGVGWRCYTSPTLERGVGRFVARCEQMRKRP